LTRGETSIRARAVRMQVDRKVPRFHAGLLQ
jgi:hypothetical protein